MIKHDKEQSGQLCRWPQNVSDHTKGYFNFFFHFIFISIFIAFRAFVLLDTILLISDCSYQQIMKYIFLLLSFYYFT